MKFPQPLSLGVQSLGRQDVGAPARAADAQYQAEQKIANAFFKVTYSQKGEEVLNTLRKGEAEEAYTSLESAHKMAIADARGYMETYSTIDPKDPDIPPLLKQVIDNTDFTDKEVASKFLNFDGTIDTSEFIRPAIYGMQGITLAEITMGMEGHINAPLYISKYTKGMQETWKTFSGDSYAIAGQHKKDNLSAKAVKNVESAVQRRDVVGALEVLSVAEKNRALPPEQVNQLRVDVPQQVNYLKIKDALYAAKTPGQLENLKTAIEASGTSLSVEQRDELRNVLDDRETKMQGEMAQRQNTNFSSGMGMLLSGTLTKKWIRDMANQHELTGSQANTLQNALDTPPRMGPSDMAALSGFRSQIAFLRRASGRPGDTIAERVKLIEDSIYRAATGITLDGGRMPVSLNGDDALKLMDELRAAEDAAMGEGSKRYTTATTVIKAVTGYSDNLTSIVEGDFPARMAYAAFISDLDTYMDSAEDNRDPLAWVLANQDKYDAVKFADKQMSQLAMQFPRYAVDIQGDKATIKTPADLAIRAGIDNRRAQGDPLRLSNDEFERIKNRTAAFIRMQQSIDQTPVTGATSFKDVGTGR